MSIQFDQWQVPILQTRWFGSTPDLWRTRKLESILTGTALQLVRSREQKRTGMGKDTSSVCGRIVPIACGSNLLRQFLVPRGLGGAPRGCGGQSHGTELQRASYIAGVAPDSTKSLPLPQCCQRVAILLQGKISKLLNTNLGTRPDVPFDFDSKLFVCVCLWSVQRDW